MGRLILALGLALVAVGVRQMWWHAAEYAKATPDSVRLSTGLLEQKFHTGGSWLVAGAALVGMGFPRGKRPGMNPLLEPLRARVARARGATVIDVEAEGS
jgi:hypothetical protein